MNKMHSAFSTTSWRRLLLGLLLPLLGAMPPVAAASGQSPPAAASSPARPDAATTGSPLSVPAPLRLKYTIHGRVSHLPYRAGGSLLWTHDGQSYMGRLAVHVFLLGSREQTSRGRITPAGLQPLHFNDRVNSDRTVEFDYPNSRIRFSEGAEAAPLPPGAQDHLSVFLQLGSLIGAAPQRYPGGTEVTLPAMGIYGPETWRFVVNGEERLSLPGGELATIKLTRAQNRPDEPGAELWLAPALGWLPARIRLTQGEGDVVDQLWRASEAP